MRKQIMLLLGLMLIGTLGVAAGIEASKSNWNYRSLLQSQEFAKSDQVLVLTAVTPEESPPQPF